MYYCILSPCNTTEKTGTCTEFIFNARHNHVLSMQTKMREMADSMMKIKIPPPMQFHICNSSTPRCHFNTQKANQYTNKTVAA